MDQFLVWKFLHIVTMFFAVGLAISGELVVRRVAASLDPVAIRTVVERTKPLGMLATGLFLAGLVFGLIAAVTGQINPFAPWLLLAYGAFALAMAIGGLVTDPWVTRLGQAAAAGGPEELRTVVEDPKARLGTVALMALLAALVFIMVVKPLGG